MPGHPRGWGAKFRFSLLLEIAPSNININIFIFIKEIQKSISFQGRPRGKGAIFIFSLLLEIGPSNIDINIFILIKKIKKKFKGVPGGRGQYLYIFFILRDRTFKHKYQYFHIYQGYKKNLYISENIHRDKQLFKLVKVLV